jgi:hypothetical protein
VTFIYRFHCILTEKGGGVFSNELNLYCKLGVIGILSINYHSQNNFQKVKLYPYIFTEK